VRPFSSSQGALLRLIQICELGIPITNAWFVPRFARFCICLCPCRYEKSFPFPQHAWLSCLNYKSVNEVVRGTIYCWLFYRLYKSTNTAVQHALLYHFVSKSWKLNMWVYCQQSISYVTFAIRHEENPLSKQVHKLVLFFCVNCIELRVDCGRVLEHSEDIGSMFLETMAPTYKSSRHHISEEGGIHLNCCENFKPRMFISFTPI
jgi:hypothetical protein